MRHYLITGGASFIGSHFIRSVLSKEKNVSITCIDDFDSFYSAQLKELNIQSFKNDPSFLLLKNDLAKTSAKELGKLIKEPVDVIIHFAAKAGVRPSIEDPLAYQQ